MIVLQQQTHFVQIELARVLRVTTLAWGLPEVGPRQPRLRKLATRIPITQPMPCQGHWLRVPTQSLRLAI